jgi:hypothetical protein
MRFTKPLRAATYIFGVVVLAASARADYITGYAWVTTNAIAGSATGATLTSLGLSTCSQGTAACTTADANATFTTSGVDFEPAGLLSGSIGNWLASNAFAIDNLVYSGASIATTALSPTIWEFVGNISVTGTVATPQTFTFEHDDGVTFIVNGQTVINQPGPTGPANTNGSYTGGASSSAPFTLIYTECCVGSAVLKVSLLAPGSAPPVSNVPEPTTIGLTAIGLVALIGRKLGWR